MTTSLVGYDFLDNKACFVCRHVMNGEAVLAFSHDEDGDIHCSCGQNRHLDDDWLVVDIKDVVTHHPDLFTLPTVRLGEVAERAAQGRAWNVVRNSEN